jgi:hypothetical protein
MKGAVGLSHEPWKSCPAYSARTSSYIPPGPDWSAVCSGGGSRCGVGTFRPGRVFVIQDFRRHVPAGSAGIQTSVCVPT